MKIAICDDDIYYREQIFTFVKSYASKNKSKEISVEAFTHGEELLENVFKHGEADIYILDVVMPGMNGIELGRELRNNGYDGKIIYLTTSEEFAIDSYKVDAFNYILKPLDKEELLACVDKAINLVWGRKEKYILVKTKESRAKLSFDSILYATLSGRSIVYYLTNGRKVESTTLRTNFAEIVKPLTNDKRFIFCGASTLCNMHHITEIESEAIVFDDTAKLFIGKKLCRDVRTAWLDFCFNEGEEI